LVDLRAHKAQPVAVERQGAVEVSYREGNDMDARLHGTRACHNQRLSRCVLTLPRT
jgi:hypothetical protein